MKTETCISCNSREFRYKNSISPPIAQSAIYTFDSHADLDAYINGLDEDTHYAYGRGDTPASDVVAEKLAALACGEDCCLCSSGMGAIALVLLSYLKSGDHLICVQHAYSTAKGFIQDMLVEHMGIQVTYVEGLQLDEFEADVKDNTNMIYLESPASAIFQLQDIEAVARLAKAKNIKVAVDNTYATMLYQKPLQLGADLEIHSLSKYINGHNDVVAGAVIGSKKDIQIIKKHALLQIGSNLSPFDAWLILRGLRTLPLRLKQQEESTNRIAQRLAEHEKITKVNHISLSNFPQRKLYEKQMSGSSGLFSFETVSSRSKVSEFLAQLQLFQTGISWGGYESTVYISSISKPYYRTAGEQDAIPVLIRLSIGLENWQDLWDDLQRALSYL